MLQTIREHTQGWIAGTIISIIILTFALWGIHSYFVGGAVNNTVAKVNGIEITKEQLTVAYERLRRQIQMQYGSNAPGKDDSTLKERALSSLVNLEVLKQASIAQGFLISNDQIDSYLENMPEFQIDGRFSVEKFQETLSSTMLSTSEFLDIIKTGLLIDQPRLGIVLSSFSLPDETTYTISLVNQERSIDYANIPLSRFLADESAISADKIKAYYDQHQADFMTPEQVNVDYIELTLKDLNAKFNPTDVMLKNFYNENINSYTQPMEWKLVKVEIPVPSNASQAQIDDGANKAAKAVELLNNGDKPESVAKEVSGKLSAESKMQSLNQVPAELQKAVADLTKSNQVSEPIKTANGFVVVKALEVTEPKLQSFEAVSQKVKDAYIRQHAEEKFAEMRERMADVTYEHPDSLKSAADALGLPIKTSELFTKDKPGKDISQYKKVREAAYSNDVMNLQNNSDVIQVNPETAIVIHVKSHIASKLIPLKDVSKQISDKLKSANAESRAEAFSHDLLAKLQSGADPKLMVSSNKLQWVSAGLIGRYSTKVDSAILDSAFRLENPSYNNGKVVYGVARIPNGYAIIALKAVKEGVITDKKQRAVFAEQVQNSQGFLEYELYKQSQTNHSKIKMMQ